MRHLSSLRQRLPVVLLVTLLASCAGNETKKSTGEFVDDAVIGTRVKSALSRDDRVRALDIKVEVFKGVVQLSGFVRSVEQIEAAEEIAAGVKGVVDVRTRMDVRGR